MTQSLTHIRAIQPGCTKRTGVTGQVMREGSRRRTSALERMRFVGGGGALGYVAAVAWQVVCVLIQGQRTARLASAVEAPWLQVIRHPHDRRVGVLAIPRLERPVVPHRIAGLRQRSGRFPGHVTRVSYDARPNTHIHTEGGQFALTRIRAHGFAARVSQEPAATAYRARRSVRTVRWYHAWPHPRSAARSRADNAAPAAPHVR